MVIGEFYIFNLLDFSDRFEMSWNTFFFFITFLLPLSYPPTALQVITGLISIAIDYFDFSKIP